MSPAVPSPPVHTLLAAGLSAPGPVRRWAITTTDGQSRSGYLPPWATDDPSEQGVAPAELGERLADVNHYVEFAGRTVSVYAPGGGEPLVRDEEILHGSIDCNPYAPGDEPRIPVVNIRLSDQSWLTDLGPEDLAGLAAQLREQARRLDYKVRPALIAARDDWAAHHPPVPDA